ncbi:MAG: CoA-binding protein [Chloroflexi bacterium]|nr:CoA-binding protein [Chloroflexota bacterium]
MSRTTAEILRETKTIAIVGLTPGRESEPVAGYLREQGYRVIPVNPLVGEVLGERSYEDLSAVPMSIDLVSVFRRSEHVAPIVQDSILIGVKAVWMQLGVTNEQAADLGRHAGLDVVMDVCIHCEHKRLAEAGEL